MEDKAQFRIGDRVKAATDIIEAAASVGSLGTITRVWERRIRALDVESGKPIVSESGEQQWIHMYDYMVDFDNGERANNLEQWEIVAESVDILATNENLGDDLNLGADVNTYKNAPTSSVQDVSGRFPVFQEVPPMQHSERSIPTLADRLEEQRQDIRRRIGSLPQSTTRHRKRKHT
jgi:hypothetical protein